MSHNWNISAAGVTLCAKCECAGGSQQAHQPCPGYRYKYPTAEERKQIDREMRDDIQLVTEGYITRADYRRMWGLPQLPEDSEFPG